MLLKAVMVLVPMILSLSVHEFAHAAVAKLLGDDTAERQGRLTLNPISHIDPIGTLGLPILLLLSGGGFFFGWAKPVPVDPYRFYRHWSPRTGMMLTAAAGPASNVVLAVLCMIPLAMGHHGASESISPAVFEFSYRMVTINLALAIFNMLPVGPLDGQKVLAGLLPHNLVGQFEQFNAQFGWMLLMGVFFFRWKPDLSPVQRSDGCAAHGVRIADLRPEWGSMG